MKIATRRHILNLLFLEKKITFNFVEIFPKFVEIFPNFPNVVESEKFGSGIREAKRENVLEKIHASYVKISAMHCQKSVNDFKPWAVF